MSYSDYLSLKKIKNISKDKILDQSGSNYVRRKQFHQLQNTLILDEDNEVIDTQRFHIHVPPIYFPEMIKPKNKAMFSIPRIHVIEYVKNRYQPPFCWTCKTPINELIEGIACMVCDSIQPIPEILYELQESIDIDMNEYLDGIYSMDLHDSLHIGGIHDIGLQNGDLNPVDVFNKIEEIQDILETDNTNITVDKINTIEPMNILFL